jgi:cation-transporting ATPase E
MADSSPSGLTSDEVAERIARGLVNRVRHSDRAEYLDICARNVLTVFNGLVVPAAIALFALGDWKGALAVSGMALTNTTLGLLQEFRAKRHLDRLTLLAEARARVRRDGQTVEIPSGDVVQGDILLLSAGDSVVADGPVLEARYLEVDEALLTGESDPVPRKPGDPLLSGSFAVTGEGVYRADRVGASAFAHKTASEARMYRYTASPLQRAINRLIQILTALAIVLSLGYLALHWWADRFGETELVQMIAATITLMIPQGLVLMTTLSLILGAVRLSQYGGIVQRLEAVETMASIDTLCMDKTGTLTTNELQFDRLVRLDSPDESVLRARLGLFATHSLDQESRSIQALRNALGMAGGEALDQLPFKAQNRYSAVRVRSPEGEECVLVLGACEALRPFLTDQRWEEVWKSLLGSGLRWLLFADLAPGEAPPRPRFDGSLEGFRLRPLALIALRDELRPEAGGVLRGLADQGIRFKILSGDNPETVKATVAALAQGSDHPALRALGTEPVVSGAQLADESRAVDAILHHSIFGRVSPWQKVEVVNTLKGCGHRVAMIGDGVNDVLPIKNANLGIAMGDGARASKSVAGLVLENNDFGLLPRALDEGRTILRNLRRAGKLFLTKNVYVPILILGTIGVFKLPFPLLPQQVTLLNFLTIGTPALLIMLGRQRSPGPVADFVREVGAFTIRTGLIIGVAGLGMFLLAARLWQEDTPTQRTLLLATLVLLGLATIVRALRDGETEAVQGDTLLYALTGVNFGLFLLILYVPPVAGFSAASFFELVPLTSGQWLQVSTVVIPAALALVCSDLATAWFRRPRAQHP